MKKALLVGIDDYPSAALDGCVADANAMAGVLEFNEDASRNYEVLVLTSDVTQVTRDALRERISDLFDNARDNELLFYFSGHGAETRWGTELVTRDYTDVSLGIAMDDVLNLATNTPAREVVIILDCCFSGDLGNIRALQEAGVDPSFRFSKALVREGVTLLAASRPREPAVEVGGHGIFTRLLLDGLEGGAADHLGHVTALSLYAFASRAFGAWEQRPMFKAHVVEPSVLRECKPFIELELLRKLPEYFDDPDAHIQMDPDYEGEGRPLPNGDRGTEKQQAFDYFKQLRNASLLTTDQEKDLYFVALASEDVYLTPFGRYFWGLAEQGRL